MSNFAKLLEHPALWRGNALARVRSGSLPTGSDRLDRELPGGGWPTGALTEILLERQGIGELSLLLPALAQLAAAGHWQSWIAPPHTPYAPRLAATGIDLSRLIVVQPSPPAAAQPGVQPGMQPRSQSRIPSRTESGRPPRPARDDAALRNTLWSVEQTLRANLCGAVLAWLPQAVARQPHARHRTGTATGASYTALRRLQLAAEAGETFVVLFRPAQAASEPSPAALRLTLSPASNGRLAVHILKRRGVAAEAPVLIDLKRPHAVDRHYAPAPAAGSLPAQRVGSNVLN